MNNQRINATCLLNNRTIIDHIAVRLSNIQVMNKSIIFVTSPKPWKTSLRPGFRQGWTQNVRKKRSLRVVNEHFSEHFAFKIGKKWPKLKCAEYLFFT